MDIDSELTKLWQCAYDNIVQYAISKNIIGKPIVLSNGCVKEMCVDKYGCIMFVEYNDNIDFAENYKDEVLYEVYKELFSY